MADAEAPELGGDGAAIARRRPRRRPAEAARRRCRRGGSVRSRDRSGSRSPTSTRTSSRGSKTSTARTLWRPATAVSSGRQSSGPRKSEMTTTRPPVVREAATARSAARTDVRRRLRRASRRRARRTRPSIAARPPLGGVRRGVRSVAPKVTMPSRSRRRATNRPTTRAAPSATSALRRSAVPKCIDGGRVEQEPGRQLAIRHVLADLRDEAPRGGVPVDPADVVAGLVRTDAVEVQPVAAAAAAVVAAQPAADAARETELELADELVGDGARAGPRRRPRSTRRPGRGRPRRDRVRSRARLAGDLEARRRDERQDRAR